MSRKRRTGADTSPNLRLDWRDPDMLVLRTVRSSTGLTIRSFTPERVQQAMQRSLDMNSAPTFAHDPTYNLRRSRRR